MGINRTLYVVTHPQSQHHVDGIVGGWFDSELSTLGTQQAGLIASELSRRIPHGAAVEVFSSDLRRTRATADAIARVLSASVEAVPGLREKSYGVAEGRDQSWLDERFAFPPVSEEPFDHQSRLDHFEGIDASETRGDLGLRVYAAMDAVLAREAEHQVVVTHGFAHTFVIGRWLELRLDTMGRANFAASPGAITELVEDDVFGNRTVTGLAAVDHLRNT